jgi:hypothetical protein
MQVSQAPGQGPGSVRASVFPFSLIFVAVVTVRREADPLSSEGHVRDEGRGGEKTALFHLYRGASLEFPPLPA